LLVGGSVTVYRVGMAVPDWPQTFGVNMFLYRFWQASWGVFIEHGHRLYGALVGLACIVLAIWFAVAERRAWMKALGGLALLAVIGQGVLGGLRVRWNSPNLALIHGCTAQLFFALMVTLCVLTGRNGQERAECQMDPDHLRRRSAVTLGLIYGQIVLGAWVRHFGDAFALILHAVFALGVWGHIAALSWRIERRRGEIGSLVASSRAMALLVVIQMLLGVGAWWLLRPFDGIPRDVTLAKALVRIGHQGVGALVLAASVVLTLRTWLGYRASVVPHAIRSAPAAREVLA
jgi:cytochrome c oxidase assembly protein subunit 15